MFPAFETAIGRIPYFSKTNVKHLNSMPKINLSSLVLNQTEEQQSEKLLHYHKLSEKQDSVAKKDSHYYVENGFRKLYPYYYQFSTHCKKRWFGKKLVDLYIEEFAYYNRKTVESRISSGLLKVNGEKVGVDYELKSSDLMTSYVHRHELPVLATPIQTLFEDENILVIDKPPSIPVHPSGMYRLNTVIFILAEEQNRTNLLLTHRLDRLTSGILIFAKSGSKSREIHDQSVARILQKEYLCRVEGNFPEGTVICDKPLKKLYHKAGVSFVHPDGKTSKTIFKKLSYNGKSSVVLCKPKTGRTHQIRVHLQYLGYPIVNDPLYNSYAFGPDKGKYGQLHKTMEQLKQDLLIKHSPLWWLANTDFDPDLDYEMNVDKSLKLDLSAKMDISTTDLFSSMSYGVLDETLLNTVYRKDIRRLTKDENCSHCNSELKDPKPCNLVMFLHAFKYTGKGWEFSTEIPRWAQSDWDIV